MIIDVPRYSLAYPHQGHRKLQGVRPGLYEKSQNVVVEVQDHKKEVDLDETKFGYYFPCP